jgi:hypothetical protein
MYWHNRYSRECLLLSTLIAAAAVQARDYRPPRLADGSIDLQGVWMHTNMTPLERPADVQALVVTPAGAARIEATIRQKFDDPNRPREPSEYFDRLTIEPVRGELHSSIITAPADGKLPGNDRFKQLARQFGGGALTAFDGPEQRPPSERCLNALSAAPPVTLVPSSDLRLIVQTPQAIVIASEELHEARVVRMNAEHAPAAVTSWLGDSIGRWEGHTLVIETTQFAPTSATRAGPSSLFFVSPHTVVTERIRRVSEDEIDYAFKVEDPTYYTQPWQGETVFQRSDARILEYACHEGNYSLRNVLESARELERAAAE